MPSNSQHPSPTIAITGASGQLGRELISLLGSGAVGLCSKSFNLTNLKQIRHTLYRLSPQVLINCAAWTRVDDAEKDSDACFAINVHAVEVLAEVCSEIGCKLVQISSDYVFGADKDRCTPYEENESPGPLNVYGHSKLEGERAAQNAQSHLIVRTCGLYSVGNSGPAFGRNFADTMLMLAKDRDTLRVVNDQICTPSYVPHVAEAITRLIHADATGIFHLTNRGHTTWHGFAIELFRQYGSPEGRQIDVIPILSKEYPSPVHRPHYSVLSNAKIEIDHRSIASALGRRFAGLYCRTKEDYSNINSRFTSSLTATKEQSGVLPKSGTRSSWMNTESVSTIATAPESPRIGTAKKWTIGFVNYYSSVYLKWQFRIIYKVLNPDDFQIVIVNNSDPDDTPRLQELAAPYQAYNNLLIVPHKCTHSRSSEQHGEGLNRVMDFADQSQYVLIQDPDFFWVGKNYLKFMESKLAAGAVAVGAPYMGPIGIGAPDFPSAFGCAYRVDSIRGLDFMPNFDPDFVNEYEKQFPVSSYPNFVSDVGFQIRAARSNEPYFTLAIRPAKHFGFDYSYQAIVQEYLLGKETFGFHLFRGCATGIPTNACDPKKRDISADIEKARNIYGRYFYYCATNKLVAKMYAGWLSLRKLQKKIAAGKV